MQEQNPYRAPATQIVDPAMELPLPIEPAGYWRRFFNMLIDYTCCRLISTGLLFVFIRMTQRAGINGLFFGTEEDPRMAFVWFWSLSAIPVYYIVTEGVFGSTVGKLVTGTRVVDERGRRPSLGQIVGRSFSRLIPLDQLSAYFTEGGECRTWHDKLSKTRVVRKR